MVTIIIPVYNNEKTVKRTLDSILKQTYPDYEVIIVNDGSEDRTGDIIRETISGDDRFIYVEQDNQGVAAARNRALETASRKYVMFVDGDDYLPPTALEYMHQVAVTNDADTIMGIYRKIDGTKTTRYKRLERSVCGSLSSEPNDPDLLYSWTMNNKWLSRDIIERNHIRFRPYRHLEDALFLYTYLSKSGAIYNCQHLVYFYTRPLPALGRTTTQRINKGLLNDAIQAYTEIKEVTAAFGEEFRKELALRYVNAPLIGEYYRRNWVLDESILDELTEAINTETSGFDSKHLEELKKRNPDLIGEDGRIKTRRELADSPRVAVLLSGDISEKLVQDILIGLYDQFEASFFVIADDRLKSSVGDRFDNYINFKWAEKDQLFEEAGRTGASYLSYIDADALYNHRTLFEAANILQEKPDADAICLQYDLLDGDGVKSSELSEYISGKDVKDLDVLFANKLLRCSSDILSRLEKGCSGADILREFRYERMDKNRVVALFDDEYVLGRAKSMEAVTEYRNYIKNKDGSSVEKKAAPKKNKISLGGLLSRFIRKSKNENKPEKKASVKKTPEYYYLKEDICRGTVVLESLSDIPDTDTLSLIRELNSGKYGALDLSFTVTDGSEPQASSVLAAEDMEGVRLINRESAEYMKRMFSAEYLFSSGFLPLWWIIKPGQKHIRMAEGNDSAESVHDLIMSNYVLIPDDGGTFLSNIEERILGVTRARCLKAGKTANNAAILCETVMSGNKNADAIKTFPYRGTPTFVFMGMSGQSPVCGWLKEIYESGCWNESVILFYPEDAPGRADIDALPVNVCCIPLNGELFSERSERKRLYGDMPAKRIILIDPDRYKTIRSYSRFTEPVDLLLTDRQMELLRAGDREEYKAMRLFRRHGRNVYVLNEKDAEWLNEEVEIRARVISTQEEFYREFFN